MYTPKESEYAALWYKSKTHIPLLGHRGACRHYPENTMPSFEAAIEAGVDLIEFDVNLTADGVPVVIHDRDVMRTSNREGLVSGYTLAQLKTFDFSAKFAGDGCFQNVPIPTLREVLELAARSDTLLLNVEIKDMRHEAVDKTIAMLAELGLCERSVIACFDAPILRYVQSAYPAMRTQGFLPRCMERYTPQTADVYDHMFGIGISIHTTPEQVARDIAFAKGNGLLPWLFCADCAGDVQKCVAWDAANITSNDPAAALETLRELGLHS